MFNFLTFILFSHFILNIFAEFQNWNLENSSIDLLLSSNSYQNIIYDESKNGIRLKLEKIIKRENGEIIQKNYVQINNNKALEVQWEDIYNFYPVDNKIYICPKGNNYLYIYSNNNIEEKKIPSKGINGNWEFTFYYHENENQSKRIMFISYLGSGDKNIYALNIDNKNIETLGMYDGYFDIIWPNNQINEEKFFIMTILKEGGNSLKLIKISITVREKTTYNYEGEHYINYLSYFASSFFDDDKYFYWIIYDEYNNFRTGYSLNQIPDNIDNINMNNIQLQQNNESPFETNNLKINYVKMIRNTKYAYYQINLNELIYHGIIDIKLNKILFNTNETITELKPFSKYSFLAITKSSAYEICVFAKSNGKCVDKCRPGQKLELYPEYGNYCYGIELCKNYIFEQNNTCIDYCDKELYTIIDNKECGLCKYLNKSFPYKIKNENYCRKETPENTYYVDESLFLLNYCHSTCKTCYGEKDNQCINCINDLIFFDEKCLLNCPDGYYKSVNENQCLNCDSNCLTCSTAVESNNNHCLSCAKNLYLITAKDMANNCVEVCPNNTKINDEKKICTDINDEKSGKGNKSLIWIIIVIIILILIIALVVYFVCKKCRNNKDNDNVNLILKSDEDNFNIRQNEGYSQESED